LNRWMFLLIVSIASFLTPFMDAVMKVVIPVIGLEFAVDPIILSWFSTSTLLSSALLYLPIGVFGDKRGRLRIFRIGLLIFSVSTFLAGLAPDEYIFLVLRFLQGCGSAAIGTAGVALISGVFPSNERGLALGINVSSVYLGLTLGPVLGGLTTALVGWRPLYIAISLMSILALYISIRYLDAEELLSGGSFDYMGSILLGVSFTSLILGLSLYPADVSRLSLAVFPIATALFIIWEYRVDDPLIDIGSVIRNRLLTFSVLTSILTYSASYGSSFLISVYLQYIMGIDPLVTGLVLISRPVLMALLSTLAGRLSDYIQPKYVVTIGLSLDVASYMMLSLLGMETSLLYIIIALALLGIGSALFSSPNTNAIMGSVEKRFYGLASGFAGTARVYGQTLSMSIISLVFSLYIGGVEVSTIDPGLLISTIDLLFLIFAVIVFIGIFPSILRGDLDRG